MKIWNYMVIFTGVAMLMEFAGIHSSGFSQLFNLIGLGVSNHTPVSFASDSSFWEKIFNSSTGILATIGGGGLIGIGGFLYTKDKAFLILPLITGTLYYWASILGSK